VDGKLTHIEAVFNLHHTTAGNARCDFTQCNCLNRFGFGLSKAEEYGYGEYEQYTGD
jgi:hypothetical protein